MAEENKNVSALDLLLSYTAAGLKASDPTPSSRSTTGRRSTDIWYTKVIDLLKGYAKAKEQEHHMMFRVADILVAIDYKSLSAERATGAELDKIRNSRTYKGAEAKEDTAAVLWLETRKKYRTNIYQTGIALIDAVTQELGWIKAPANYNKNFRIYWTSKEALALDPEFEDLYAMDAVKLCDDFAIKMVDKIRAMHLIPNSAIEQEPEKESEQTVEEVKTEENK